MTGAIALVLAAALATMAACGGSVASSSSGDPATTTACPGNPAGGACAQPTATPPATNFPPPNPPPARVPEKHRASATPCDTTRPTTEPTSVPDGGAAYVECRTNEECTQGVNGRCTGNGHDGWRCTYDACTTDGDCKGGQVCQCEGGFRADNNVCLESGCRVDADCGPGGYCSPTLGDCGAYGGIVGYFCHQREDECIDDADCTGDGGGGSCRYERTVGHWRCSAMECAG